MGKITEEQMIRLYGSVQAYKEHIHKQLSGKHYYTNGVEDKKFGDDEEIPEGWWKGRTNCGKGTKGSFFINNGVKQTLVYNESEIPEGWVKGGLPFTEEHKKNLSNSLTGKKRTLEQCKNIKQAHQTQEYKNKIKQINLEKYGVECVFQNEKIKEKVKQTNLEKYGVEYALQSEVVKGKVKQTNLAKRNVEYPMQSEQVKETLKQNNLEKYGVESVFQLPEVQEKVKQTNLERYGVEYASSSPIIREKVKQTILEHYGVEHHLKLPQIMQKQIDTNMQNNGVMYNIQLSKIYTNNSKPNQNFTNLLDNNDIQYTREISIGKYSYDFRVNDTLIEINPFATHNSLWGIFDNDGTDKYYHYNKTKFAEENGYRVIHIFDWDDKNKIVNLLMTREKIYARKCELKIINNKDCKNFLNNYHLQGNCKGQKICLGLYYNNELVSVMTFGKPLYNKNYEWELLRYCSIKAVIGGSQKLFKFFIDNYSPQSIISYCDKSKFKGDVYNKLGFTLQKEEVPTKHWYNPKTGQHITDNLLLQLGFDNIFGTNYGKNANNEELIINEGFVPIYDCGQDVYVYVK